ncbi:hypothetical protein ERJ75_000335500 [Trypanosoma vivax]|nr:hypothetical protein ERJ75_000335500 [Trypanosoma vivax]
MTSWRPPAFCGRCILARSDAIGLTVMCFQVRPPRPYKGKRVPVLAGDGVAPYLRAHSKVVLARVAAMLVFSAIAQLAVVPGCCPRASEVRPGALGWRARLPCVWRSEWARTHRGAFGCELGAERGSVDGNAYADCVEGAFNVASGGWWRCRVTVVATRACEGVVALRPVGVRWEICTPVVCVVARQLSSGLGGGACGAVAVSVANSSGWS